MSTPELVSSRAGRLQLGRLLEGRGRPLVMVAGFVAAVVIFAAVASLRGADPADVLNTMISTFTDTDTLQQSLLRAVPIVLAAMAALVPARAGLVNVGGEGQLIMGAVAATGSGVALGGHLPGPLSWLVMGLAGAAAGALWGGLSGLLRTWLSASEAVTSLLLNFVANDVMLYLIYQSWKDPNGSGQPQSRPLASRAQLPHLFGSQIGLGVLVAAAAVLVCWWLVARTGWGFALRAVGGNGEASRRAGLPVRRLLLSSMVVGGAFAGLGGALNLAGVELQLRPDITATYGYIGFLAAFLGAGRPLWAALAGVVFAVIQLSGNTLQIMDGLDGSMVDVLLALVVAVPLVIGRGGRSS